MPFKPPAITTLLVCITSMLSAQPNYLLHKTYAERYEQMDSINQQFLKLDTAGAEKEIQMLINWAGEMKDESLAYSFLIIKYNYSFHKKKDKSGAVEGLKTIIDRVHNSNMVDIEAQAMATLGDFYLGDYNTSAIGFDYALKAYDIYAHMDPGKFPGKSLYLFNLGINHLRFKDYANGKRYFIEAIHCKPIYKVPKAFNIYNAIGLCYRNVGQYDSAENFFKQAYAHTTPSDSTWRGIIGGNIGITYYYLGRYKEAKPLLESDVKASLARNQIVNAAKSLAILGDIYLIQNDKKKALELLQQSYDLIFEGNKRNDYETLQQIYPRLAKVYAANGDLQKAYAFMDSAMIVRDSVTNQKNVMKLARVQQKQEQDKYEAEVQQLNDQKRLHGVIRNSLIGGIVLLAVIALLFINRQRLKNNQREQQLLAEKEIAESKQQLAQADLQSASRQLGDFTRNIQEKNELIEKFSAEIERLQALPCSIELPDTRENLMKLQQSTILTEDQWEDFRTVFEKVHSGFFIRLREKLPDLSPAEIRFVALSKLRLHNKEMAGILGISTDAVRMNRHRLRKKLELPEEDSLENLIETI